MIPPRSEAKSFSFLKEAVEKLKGKGYSNYKRLSGLYDFGRFLLEIHRVQSDPFAPPSRVRVWIPQTVASFPLSLYRNDDRALGLEDYLYRKFHSVLTARKYSDILVDAPSAQVLKRTSVKVAPWGVEFRFFVKFPGRGRRIDSDRFKKVFFEWIPGVVSSSLIYTSLSPSEVQHHVEVVEDSRCLRRLLKKNSYVAFVPDGAVLPRESGVSEKPLRNAVRFKSPESLAVEFNLPNRGKIRGMAIPAGITLIVGGGFHGKSTLLEAIQMGVYDHPPGDGREFVVSIEETVKVRAEDGRSVTGVDISPFVKYLPGGKNPRFFTTSDASGSTSQAAYLMEALEVGAKLILMDEDTSATNLLIRDARMQRLIASDDEPLVPFIDRIRQLYKEFGVSTIMVFGGSGDYFDVADLVIAMKEYTPYDVTAEAKKIASQFPSNRVKEVPSSFGEIKKRYVDFSSLGGTFKRKALSVEDIKWGRERLEIWTLEQLCEVSQVRGIVSIMSFLGNRNRDFQNVDFPTALERVLSIIESSGFEAIGSLEWSSSVPRIFELAGAINRFRRLRVRGGPSPRAAG